MYVVAEIFILFGGSTCSPNVGTPHYCSHTTMLFLFLFLYIAVLYAVGLPEIFVLFDGSSFSPNVGCGTAIIVAILRY